MKVFVLGILSVLGLFGAAGISHAGTCDDVIAEIGGTYKGVVATITQVSVSEVTGTDALGFGEGTRYDFVYRHPRGASYTFAVVAMTVDFVIKTGDFLAWAPLHATQKVSSDAQVIPVVIDHRTCRVLAIDMPSPAISFVALR